MIAREEFEPMNMAKYAGQEGSNKLVIGGCEPVINGLRENKKGSTNLHLFEDILGFMLFL